jgi:BlaI family transcriptional regulator, penicillinase repressor
VELTTRVSDPTHTDPYRLNFEFWVSLRPFRRFLTHFAANGFIARLHPAFRLRPDHFCNRPHCVKMRDRFLRMKRIFHFRSSSSELGPLETRLLEALWARGNATVRELIDNGHQDLAYTTVMTTLDRLFKKGLLAREAEGRAFRYSPRLTREELHREVAGEAVRQMLDASPASSLPLSYLVEILSERDAQLLDQLRQLVEDKRRELRSAEMRAVASKSTERT